LANNPIALKLTRHLKCHAVHQDQRYEDWPEPIPAILSGGYPNITFLKGSRLSREQPAVFGQMRELNSVVSFIEPD
jgi:hypothetical protein